MNPFMDVKNYISQYARFRLGSIPANEKPSGFMVAMWGTGPARLASSKCHDFTVDHGFSSGVRRESTGKRLVSQIAGNQEAFHRSHLVYKLQLFAFSRFPLRQTDQLHLQRGKCGNLGQFLFIEPVLASLKSYVLLTLELTTSTERQPVKVLQNYLRFLPLQLCT